MPRPTGLRRVGAQTVLSLRRRISIDELDDHIESSMRLLECLAPVAAPHFVVYCDGLETGKDGTVEVCQPVDEHAPHHQDLPAAVVRRIEDAHCEAWVTVTRAELAYPEIDDVYDELDAACRRRGWERHGAPREVYWANWDFLRMDDPACDVCFPIVDPDLALP
ncbi:GyrI-like domain-containing protein [Acidipropionibacterium virtanenii]|uniref:GyrI-like domain-containing protein n=1 Tax=Acidipropionibacterium virtanenii TaxID=2057246 RepID=UPI003CCC6EDB